MENVTEILEAITDFSEFVKSRTLELLIAGGYKRKVRFYKIYFETDCVCVSFKEDTNHDCPEYTHVDLSIPQLEMNDLEWNAYVDSVKNKAFMAEVDNIKLAKERELANKEKQYLKLKQELGH